MMTTETIGEAAIAAFETRYRGRPAQWDAQPWHVQQRWIQITAYALNGSVTSGEEFRFRYIRDHYPHDDAVKPWSQIGRVERISWNAVYASIRTVGEREIGSRPVTALDLLPYPVTPATPASPSEPETPKPSKVKATTPRKPTTRTTPKPRSKPPAPRPLIAPADEPMLTPVAPLRERLTERRKNAA